MLALNLDLDFLFTAVPSVSATAPPSYIPLRKGCKANKSVAQHLTQKTCVALAAETDQVEGEQ